MVDFIIAESYEENKGYSLYVNSGYKAGLQYVILPEKSIPEFLSGYVIERKWLIDNREKRGYFDCPVSEVLMVRNDLPPYGFPPS